MEVSVKLLYISLLSLAFLPCAAMNQSSSHDGIFYLVEASDGQLVELPESVIRRLKVLNDCFKDTAEDYLHNAYAGIKEKVTGKADKNILFFSLKDRSIPQDIPLDKDWDIPVDSTLLQDLSDCLRGVKKVKQLDPKKLNELFEAADCLGAPRAFLRKLTLYARKCLPKDEQHRLICCGHYLNSLNTFIDNGYFTKDNEQNYLSIQKDQNNNDIITLQLSGLELDNLQGIDKVARIVGTGVHKICLETNKLVKINLSKFWELFPHLNEISLAHNKITKACLSIPNQSYSMPVGAIINLSDNRLKKIKGKLSEAAILDIQKNTISPELKNCLELIQEPTFYQNNHYFIKALKSNYFLSNMKKGTEIGLMGVGMLPLSVSLILYYKKVQKLPSETMNLEYAQIFLKQLKDVVTDPLTYKTALNYFSGMCLWNVSVNLICDRDFYKQHYGFILPQIITD